jgi:hypothetical protein
MIHEKSEELSNMTQSQKERLKRLFRWKQDSEKARSDYSTKEHATRLRTAKLAERLAREAHFVAKTKTTSL